MIYFDNAATSFPKPKEVIDAYNFCLKKSCGNPGRSSHSLSLRASEVIYEARERVASFLNSYKPEGIVFTYNATHALNIAIKGFIHAKSHVIISDMEHNSVLRPLEKLKKEYGVEVSEFSTSAPDLESEIDKYITSNTVAIISTLASNVTGRRVNLASLSHAARKHGIYLIVDASQAIGHIKIDLKITPCDVLCAPAHKALFGVQGLGFAYFKDTTRGLTLMEGGSGTDSISTEMPLLLPEGYEAGTPATPAIAALASGIDVVDKIGLNNIENRLSELEKELSERILSLPKTKIYGADMGIVSFNYDNIPSSYISAELDKHGICTRSGLHCAPSAHKKLGTLTCGTVRVSLSFFNNRREIEKFYKAMGEIAKRI